MTLLARAAAEGSGWSARAPPRRRRSNPFTAAHADAGCAAAGTSRSRLLAARPAAGMAALARLGAGATRTLAEARSIGAEFAHPLRARHFRRRGRRTDWPVSAAPSARLTRHDQHHDRRDQQHTYDVDDYRCRCRRHSHRSSTGAVSVAHRDAGPRRRCRHRNVKGQHGHPAHRVRHAPGNPRIRGLVRPGARIADRLRPADQASPSRGPAPSWSPGTRIRRRGWTRWWGRTSKANGYPRRANRITPAGVVRA